ncbi:MAG: site-2 protease family protein [Dehalococcoidia bacterium]|nr:site-2 protease family protein [Dehalococcoidia bacterium]
MIWRNWELFRDEPGGFLVLLLLTVLALVVAATFHELSHAVVATRFGDRTPGRAGRLSLNPLVHLDPLGGLMLLFVGFGWAKPVPVNPAYFGRDALRKTAVVALAGPLTNLMTAFLAALPFRAGIVDWPIAVDLRLLGTDTDLLAATLLGFIVIYSLILAAFNLIPLAPLDGSKVLPGILPRELGERLQRLEPWGPGILLMAIMSSIFFDVPILEKTIGPVVNVLSTLLVDHSIF